MVAAILPIGYFGYHSIKSASSSLQDDALMKMYLDVFSRGKDIENHLNNSRADLLYLRSSAPLEYLLEAIELNDIASFTYWRTLLEKEFFNLVEQKAIYLQAGFLSFNGDEMVLVAYDMRHPVILPKSSLHNQRESLYFQTAAKLSQNEIASIPLRNYLIKGLALSNIALIRYIAPVHSRSGKWMGAIYLDVTGRHLHDTMKRAIGDKSSRIFLVNNKGFYFFNPEWETEDGLLDTTETSDNINDTYSKAVASQVLSGRSGVIMDDNENLFAYTPIFPDERNKEFYYTVVESYPKNMLTAGVKDYKRLFIAAILAAVILTIIIGIFISKMLTYPISRLKEGARLIGKGNLDYRLDIRSGDEVEEMAGEFNNMAEKLKIYSRCLEEKVEERTRQVRDYEKQLIHSEKMASLGLLAAGVAHEINNPIGIIINRIEALKMENTNGDIPEKVVKDLDTMMHHAMRVSKITGNLLSFSRESSYEFNPQDINKIIERVLMFLEGSISKKGIMLEKSLYNELPLVFGSAAGLEQVFLNIIHNAMDATNSGGRISIETACKSGAAGKENGFVNIIISDTGNGISGEYIGKVFDPFFTTKEIGKGTGLGLSISYGIIKEHGGDIKVVSEISKGTAFTIMLPVMEE